jgi:hypothetical protein
MKPLFRRLHLLERALMVTEEVTDENSPAAIIRARRLRRLQEWGDRSAALEVRPRIEYRPGMSIADILRQGRLRARLSTSESTA